MLPCIRYEYTRRERAHSIWMCSCLSLGFDLALLGSSIFIALSLDVYERTPRAQPWQVPMPAPFKRHHLAPRWLLKKESYRLAPSPSLLLQGLGSTTFRKGW